MLQVKGLRLIVHFRYQLQVHLYQVVPYLVVTLYLAVCIESPTICSPFYSIFLFY